MIKIKILGLSNKNLSYDLQFLQSLMPFSPFRIGILFDTLGDESYLKEAFAAWWILPGLTDDGTVALRSPYMIKVISSIQVCN